MCDASGCWIMAVACEQRWLGIKTCWPFSRLVVQHSRRHSTETVACPCLCLSLRVCLQPKYEAYMKLFEPLCGPPPQRPILTEGANKVRLRLLMMWNCRPAAAYPSLTI